MNTAHLTTTEAGAIIAGDILPNRGTVMSVEHGHDDRNGMELTTLWFRKDGTDAFTVSADDLVSWTEESHRMVWVFAED